MKNDNLFYTCSLIEYIGRKTKRKRSDVIDCLGKEKIARIYKDAPVLHCEPIDKVADECIALSKIASGSFDNVSACKYNIPNYWDIGDVYTRLIEDVGNGDVVDSLVSVFNSDLGKQIQNFNWPYFYQPREYLAAAYRGEAD